jgi:carbon monoxide dehydrogenase subunit G
VAKVAARLHSVEEWRMKLEHNFTVPVPVAQAWGVLLDLPTVAPCMPGAALTSYEGDDFTGTVKVKLGPINLTYQGKGRIVEKDEADHRAVIEAHGKESRGSGTAKATVTARLHSNGDDSTQVDVVTDLNITGRPAQFGRGMMVDVGNKLIGQFADCLSQKLQSGAVPATTAPSAPKAPDLGQDAATGAVAAPTVTEAPAEASRESSPQPFTPTAGHEVEPIDLLHVTGANVMLKRVAKYGAALAVGVVIGWLLSRWLG